VAGLFTLATALGAALLFLVEPMVAKAMLPWLGGTAAVWTVSLVFFQSTLLAGYLYAHLLARRPLRQMVIGHGAVMAVALLLLLWRGTTPHGPVRGPPALWILLTLTASVGLPFLVLSATGPLLQRWLAALPAGRDPYRLYSVSNASSLVALLAYPFIVERTLPLAGFAGDATRGLTQNGLWAGLFAAFVGLVVFCGVRVLRAEPAPAPARQRRSAEPAPTRTTLLVWARWLALAFVPSAAMLGTTQALTTDVASVPLLWVIPLAVYLLSFVVAFRRPDRLPIRIISWATAALVLGVAAMQWLASRPPVPLALALYMLMLFAVGLLCHGRLAQERPAPAALTGFYLAIAAGGALGSVFCGLIAPVVFRSVAELPIALALACLWRLPDPFGPTRRWLAGLLDAGLVVALAILVVLVHAVFLPTTSQFARSAHAEVAIVCLACAALAVRRRAFAGGVALVLVLSAALGPMSGFDMVVRRSFFGVLRVKNAPGLPFSTDEGPNARQMQFPMHELYHGTTMHGIQLWTGDQAQLMPTAYFHPNGPLGRLVAALRGRPGRPQLGEVAVVGLGTGAVAAYALPGERFTFFEIDPEVVRIARDPGLFTYLKNSGPMTEVILADGRIGLAATADGRFDLVVMDAFSSDAVPVHLLTREAMELYLRKLRPGGLLAYHVSSTFFDLAPVLAEAAAVLGKEGLYWYDQDMAPAALAVGKLPSCWVVVAREVLDLGTVHRTGPWTPLSQRRTSDGPGLWTDRYSSPLAALKR
jgi:SAM-dependent methyltransferase